MCGWLEVLGGLQLVFGRGDSGASKRALEAVPIRSRARLRFPCLATLSDTFEYPLPISLVVGARGLLAGLPVRGVIAALLLEDLLPVLEVVATAPNRTTGFAAPAEAVPGPLSAIILAQGRGLVAIGAGLRLQDLAKS